VVPEGTEKFSVTIEKTLQNVQFFTMEVPDGGSPSLWLFCHFHLVSDDLSPSDKDASGNIAFDGEEDEESLDSEEDEDSGNKMNVDN
jgi:hypothetical protein